MSGSSEVISLRAFRHCSNSKERKYLLAKAKLEVPSVRPPTTRRRNGWLTEPKDEDVADEFGLFSADRSYAHRPSNKRAVKLSV